MAKINDIFRFNSHIPDFSKNIPDPSKFMSDISKHLPDVSKLVSPINLDSNTTKTTEDAIDEENKHYDEISFDIDDKVCEICKSTLEDGCYVLCNDDDKHYFCSAKCLSQSKKLDIDVNDYDLYEISRCVSYKCCLELGNLRRMCENVEKKNTNYIANLSIRKNFCEPAAAGQIQAFYAIYKYLNKVQSENEKMSVENTKLNKKSQILTLISTTMAGITILLTIINIVQSCNNKTVDIMQEIKTNQETLIEAVNTGNEDMNSLLKNSEEKISNLEENDNIVNEKITELENNIDLLKTTKNKEQ